MAYDVRAKAAALEDKYNLPTGLYQNLILHGERSGARAVSPRGAVGYAQLMPGTARDMGVQDIWDPDQNLEGGAKYLSMVYNQFKQDPRLALAAYNAGPTAVRKYGGVPPYAETRSYVERVMAANGVAPAPPGGAMPTTAPMPTMAPVDPQAQAGVDEYAAQRADASKLHAEVDQQLQDLNKRYEEIDASALPERPPPPSIRDLPPSPEAKDYIKDPTRVLGQVLPALTILGSLTMRNGALNAMSAATAAMNAARTNDKEDYERAHTDWKAKMEQVLKQSDQERQQYQAILEDQRLTLAEKSSQLQVLAAKGGNLQMREMVKNNQLGQLYNQLQLQEALTYKGWQVYDMAQNRDLQRQRLDLDNKKLTLEEKKAADMDAYRDRQNEIRAASASKESVGQLVAKLSQEKRAGVTGQGQPWGSADEQALQDAEALYQNQKWATPSAGASAPTGQPVAPVVTNGAVDYLRKNNTPEIRAQFDAKYGVGAARKYLGN